MEEFQAQDTGCVNFPWLPEPADIPVTGPSKKAVDVDLPGNGFGAYPTYMWRRQKRTRKSTDCFSTATETMGKKLVRTRSYGFMYPYIYMCMCVCVSVCVCVCM
jgi:hypothetical protein